MASQLVIGGEVIDNVVINDDASEIKCTDADGNESNVQDVLDKQNKNFDSIKYLPDYSNITTISSLPFTAPSNGVFYLTVGGSANGTRNFYINDNNITTATFAVNTTQTVTLIVSEGDVLTSDYGIFGTYRFVPFK